MNMNLQRSASNIRPGIIARREQSVEINTLVCESLQYDENLAPSMDAQLRQAADDGKLQKVLYLI